MERKPFHKIKLEDHSFSGISGTACARDAISGSISIHIMRGISVKELKPRAN